MFASVEFWFYLLYFTLSLTKCAQSQYVEFYTDYKKNHIEDLAAICDNCGRNHVFPAHPFMDGYTCEKMHTCCVACYEAAGGQCPRCSSKRHFPHPLSEGADQIPKAKKIKYSFHYYIDHAASNVHINHREERHGDQVMGQYGLLEPGGYVRNVHYSVDGNKGFRAIVQTRTAASRTHQLVQLTRNQPRTPVRHAEPVAFVQKGTSTAGPLDQRHMHR